MGNTYTRVDVWVFVFLCHTRLKVSSPPAGAHLLQVSSPVRAQYVRVTFSEITRILNNLFAVGCHAVDVGALTLFSWSLEESEKIMEYHERVSGARMHANYLRPGGVRRYLDMGLSVGIYFLLHNLASKQTKLKRFQATIVSDPSVVRASYLCKIIG